MPDPIINEALILEILQEPFGPANAERLASAAVLAVADAHDRKVERNSFLDLVDVAFNLNAACVQSLLLSNILQKKADRSYSDDHLVDGLKVVNKMGEERRDNLFRMADLVSQCPREHQTQH